jgi:helix-turn-helix protein
MINILGTEDPLLAEHEAAAELNRSPRTLRRWRNLREAAPHVKLGREIYYRRSALRAWLIAREGRAS